MYPVHWVTISLRAVFGLHVHVGVVVDLIMYIVYIHIHIASPGAMPMCATSSMKRSKVTILHPAHGGTGPLRSLCDCLR